MSTNQNNEKENFLSLPDKRNPFIVPKGYFDAFSGRLLNRMEAQRELEQYRALAAISKQYVLSVPQNYFVKNQNLLEYQYELSVYRELGKIKKAMPQPLAEGYFDALSEKVLKKIELSGELEGFETLSKIERRHPFAVTPDYFEAIADKVKERYHSAKKQEIPLLDRLFIVLFKPKMAFAYSLVLLMAIGVFYYFNQKETLLPAGDCKTLACLERNELLNDRTMQNLDEENLYELVDVDELDAQLSGITDSHDNKTNTDSLPENLK